MSVELTLASSKIRTSDRWVSEEGNRAKEALRRAGGEFSAVTRGRGGWWHQQGQKGVGKSHREQSLRGCWRLSLGMC